MAPSLRAARASGRASRGSVWVAVQLGQTGQNWTRLEVEARGASPCPRSLCSRPGSPQSPVLNQVKGLLARESLAPARGLAPRARFPPGGFRSPPRHRHRTSGPGFVGPTGLTLLCGSNLDRDPVPGEAPTSPSVVLGPSSSLRCALRLEVMVVEVGELKLVAISGTLRSTGEGG
ncbi:uncharacterized protein LOC116559268 isoform X1 [Sapajus apella]|uniref:Uncharacterized protein LOC116559268 isoform X1 n=1 Tax=Sapajus apella TaxID=9515 RepID=A0A6J3IUQ1_SAPAP|nr:uncharacterized protein LOC116559268 isoform X1 [Sapajus apella]